MFAAGWFLRPAPETVTIKLTESETQQVIQRARLGYITLDSAKALIISESKIKWIPRDSIVYDYRDSIITHIRDSIIYVPFYAADDTIINFYDTTEIATVSLSMKLKQRFFPLQERFASGLTLMSLTVTIPEAKESSSWFGDFFKNRFIIYMGVGVNYSGTTFDPGFQVGAGIRIL
jgi:hypothetical protein